MEVEKLRNLTDAELQHQQRELNDQLFKLKFQLKMGQTESLNKIRGLRKDVARIQTIFREKQLGVVRPVGVATPGTAAATTAAEKKAAPAAKSVRSKAAKPAKKKTAGKKTASAKTRKK